MLRDALFNGGIHAEPPARIEPPPQPPADHPHLELVQIPPGVQIGDVVPELAADSAEAGEENPPALKCEACGVPIAGVLVECAACGWQPATQPTAPDPPVTAGEPAAFPESAPVPGYVAGEPLPSGALQDPHMIAALQALRDGAAGVVAITYLDGDHWRHVVSTQDFNQAFAHGVLQEWEAQLARQREASA